MKIISTRYKNECFELIAPDGYKNYFSNNIILKKYNRKLDKILKLFTIRNLSYEKIYMKNAEYTILIGGSMFIQNSKSVKIRNNYLAGKNKKYILGSNFGPYTTQEFLDKFKEIFSKASDVCFRDKYSYNLFKELPNVRVAPDIVFGLDVSNVKITNNKKVIISVIDCHKDNMNINQDLYNQKINELIDFFVGKGYEIVLMSFSKPQGDENVIEQIIENSNNKKFITKYFYRGDIDEALNIIGDSQIVVGTRFHANILGMIMGKTVIPIAYSDKTINVLHDMNFKGKFFNLNDMESFDISKICEADLTYKHDITFQKNNAWRHFEKLDEVLRR